MLKLDTRVDQIAGDTNPYKLLFNGRVIGAVDEPWKLKSMADEYRAAPHKMPPPPLDGVVKVRIQLSVWAETADYARELYRQTTGEEINEQDKDGFIFYDRHWNSEWARKKFGRRLTWEVVYYPASGHVYRVRCPAETAMSLLYRGLRLGMNDVSDGKLAAI